VRISVLTPGILLIFIGFPQIRGITTIWPPPLTSLSFLIIIRDILQLYRRVVTHGKFKKNNNTRLKMGKPEERAHLDDGRLGSVNTTKTKQNGHYCVSIRFIIR
jgi:hypothetical protein